MRARTRRIGEHELGADLLAAERALEVRLPLLHVALGHPELLVGLPEEVFGPAPEHALDRAIHEDVPLLTIEARHDVREVVGELPELRVATLRGVVRPDPRGDIGEDAEVAVGRDPRTCTVVHHERLPIARDGKLSLLHAVREELPPERVDVAPGR